MLKSKNVISALSVPKSNSPPYQARRSWDKEFKENLCHISYQSSKILQPFTPSETVLGSQGKPGSTSSNHESSR
ncbi:hypothetical protein M8J76_000018 [Diaphorina citri]|nr:hypothetical protein M8J76_000018 [Diaphorina citri]